MSPYRNLILRLELRLQNVFLDYDQFFVYRLLIIERHFL